MSQQVAAQASTPGDSLVSSTPILDYSIDEIAEKTVTGKLLVDEIRRARVLAVYALYATAFLVYAILSLWLADTHTEETTSILGIPVSARTLRDWGPMIFFAFAWYTHSVLGRISFLMLEVKHRLGVHYHQFLTLVLEPIYPSLITQHQGPHLYFHGSSIAMLALTSTALGMRLYREQSFLEYVGAIFCVATALMLIFYIYPDLNHIRKAAEHEAVPEG